MFFKWEQLTPGITFKPNYFSASNNKRRELNRKQKHRTDTNGQTAEIQLQARKCIKDQPQLDFYLTQQPKLSC